MLQDEGGQIGWGQIMKDCENSDKDCSFYPEGMGNLELNKTCVFKVSFKFAY